MRLLLGIGAVVVVVLGVLLFRELRGDDGAAGATAARQAGSSRASGAADEATPAARTSGEPRRAGRPPLPGRQPRSGGTASPAAPGGAAAGEAPALPAGEPAATGPVFAPGTPLEEKITKVQELWFARDYEAALAGATATLEDNPGDAKALWVAVASACMLGDVEQAQTYFDQVRVRNNPERERLAERCRDAGVELME